MQLQRVTRDYRGLPGLTKCENGLQGVTNGYKLFQRLQSVTIG